jgi:hypothetical protein
MEILYYFIIYQHTKNRDKLFEDFINEFNEVENFYKIERIADENVIKQINEGIEQVRNKNNSDTSDSFYEIPVKIIAKDGKFNSEEEFVKHLEENLSKDVSKHFKESKKTFDEKAQNDIQSSSSKHVTFSPATYLTDYGINKVPDYIIEEQSDSPKAQLIDTSVATAKKTNKKNGCEII